LPNIRRSADFNEAAG
jgi:HAMP domain-containing protein